VRMVRVSVRVIVIGSSSQKKALAGGERPWMERVRMPRRS
jgi:hypothetical protein